MRSSKFSCRSEHKLMSNGAILYIISSFLTFMASVACVVACSACWLFYISFEINDDISKID